MSRVKFAAKQEYEYLENYKVLQNAFKVHKIDKVNSPSSQQPCLIQEYAHAKASYKGKEPHLLTSWYFFFHASYCHVHLRLFSPSV